MGTHVPSSLENYLRLTTGGVVAGRTPFALFFLGFEREPHGAKVLFFSSLPFLLQCRHYGTTYMTTHPEQYPFLRNDTLMVSKIRKMEQNTCVVNSIGSSLNVCFNAALRRQKKYIKNGDIIALGTSKAGLDVAHLGIASWLEITEHSTLWVHPKYIKKRSLTSQ